MNTLTSEDIKVLQKGLELAKIGLDELPFLVEDDFDPGTFERWEKDYSSFQELVNKLTKIAIGA